MLGVILCECGLLVLGRMAALDACSGLVAFCLFLLRVLSAVDGMKKQEHTIVSDDCQ